MTFKDGDRVLMIEPQSKYTGKVGTVKGYSSSAYRELKVQFDCNANGHLVYFPPHYFKKEENTMYRVDDRVRYIKKNHALNGSLATVIHVNGEYLTVQFDATPVTIYDHMSKFDPVNPVDNYKHYTDVTYHVKCARWFKSAYASITKAGGVPEHVIDKLPADVLDTLIKNNLHLEYKP